MTGRGVDQILPHPCKPNLYEPYVRSALDYVQLAENVTGALTVSYTHLTLPTILRV